MYYHSCNGLEPKLMCVNFHNWKICRVALALAECGTHRFKNATAELCFPPISCLIVLPDTNRPWTFLPCIYVDIYSLKHAASEKLRPTVKYLRHLVAVFRCPKNILI